MSKDLAVSFFPFRLRLGRDETPFGKMGFVALLGCVEAVGAPSGAVLGCSWEVGLIAIIYSAG